MEAVKLSLEGLMLLKTPVFSDSRGFFLETYQKEALEKWGISCPFVQDNHSYSTQGCIRGMHFQTFPGQAKLVRAAVGAIFDVAVDMRKGSPTYGQWEGVVLDGESHHQLFIPVGFAHGFCVLTKEAHVMYKVSHPYHPASEKGFRFDDPLINIKWPIAQPLLSERDKAAPFFSEITFPYAES